MGGDVQVERVIGAPPHAGSLARLDEARVVNLETQAWPDNLAALRQIDSLLADQLEQTPLPECWRPVQALDGCITFRTEPPGQAPSWLAASAAPMTRAHALLADFRPGDKNPALPSIAAGSELTFLLGHLPTHKAVFVFESELAALAAVLRVVDLAEHIRAGRCVLIAPEREETSLAELLERHPGLLPPGNILRLPHVPASRLEQLRATCERVALRTMQQRAQRIDELARAAAAELPAATSTPRLAVLALGPDRPSLVAGRALARAAGELGWEVRRCAPDGPRDIHVLAHVEALANYAPSLTICVNHARARMPRPLPGLVCEWYLAADDVPEQLPDDATWRLAASPAVAAALRADAPAGESRLLDFYWACASDTVGDAAQRSPSDAIVLVADLPNDNPEAYGFDQTAHKQLWEHLHAATDRAWETRDIRSPETLLRHAERASGVRLAISSLRHEMLRVVEHVLIPAVVLGRIVQILEQERLRVLAVGRGWRRCPSRNVELLTEDALELSRWASEARPAAAIFAARPDPLTPALLEAGLLGWPLLLHSLGGEPLAVRLGKILQPDQHFQAFTGAKQLRNALRLLRERPEQIARRIERARRHLLQHHSYAQRLEALARQVGLRPTHNGSQA
jgi:hypothetical protein